MKSPRLSSAIWPPNVTRTTARDHPRPGQANRRTMHSRHVEPLAHSFLAGASRSVVQSDPAPGTTPTDRSLKYTLFPSPQTAVQCTRNMRDRPLAYCFLASATRSQSRCPQDKGGRCTVDTTLKPWNKLDLSVPRWLRKYQWQVEDITAGGDLGESKPSIPSHGPCQEPLS